MFSKLASWVKEGYKARKQAGSLILIRKVQAELLEQVADAMVGVADTKAALLAKSEEKAELLRKLIRRGKDDTCTCGKCKDLIPQRKREFKSIEREVICFA